MKKSKSASKDWLRPEYTRSDFGPVVRGKYANRSRVSTNVVVLDPQVARVFPNEQAVNNALRGLIGLARSCLRPRSSAIRPRSKPTRRRPAMA